MLDVARAVQGVGAAAMFAVSLALLASAFPGGCERAGRALIVGAALAAVGSIATGRLLRGWRPEAATSRPAIGNGLAFDAA